VFFCVFLSDEDGFLLQFRRERDPKLSEYQQVDVRVRGAGCRDREELNKRESNKPIFNGHNGDNDEIVLDSPTPSSGGIPSAKDLHARSAQDPDLKSHKTNASLLGSTHLWDKSLTGQAPAHSVTLNEQTKLSKGRGEARQWQMAKRAAPNLNGYCCQKLQTRRWRKLTRVRLSALNAIISPRYL
jgi:hypothetical protein